MSLLSAGSRVYVILVGPMGVVVHFHRYDIDPAVSHLAHGHQFVGELAHFRGCPAKNDGLHAVVVVEMNVHR